MDFIRKTLSACLKALFSPAFFKQAFAWIFVISLIFPPQLAWAFFDYPEPVEAMDQIMTDLGMEKDELRKSVADNNVSRFKKSFPTATLKFVPESPVDKKELTATAVPANFTGNPEQMYYTWYLKHEECEEAEKGDSDYVAECDWTKDDQVDIEDWKVEAMRLLANGGADPTLFDYSGDPDDDADDDGYDSVFGGEDQRWKPEHCYVRDIESGIDYEIHGGYGELGTGEAMGYGSEGSDRLPVDISEVNFIGTGTTTVGSNVGEWEINPFLQSVEIPEVQEKSITFNHDGSAAWPDIYNFFGKEQTCDPEKESSCIAPESFDNGSASQGDRCEDHCSDSLCAWNFCSEGAAWIIWEEKIGGEYNGNWRGERLDWLRPTQTVKSEAWENVYPVPGPAFENISIDGCKTYGFMVTALGKGNSVRERTNIVSATMPGENCGPVCNHVFPKKYYVDGNQIKTLREDDEDLLVGDSDKGGFTTMEEKFWGTDPESKDTNNDGVPDEQALTGFGMMSFKWTYQSGDMIGVAIEGVADNTDYKDSSMKTMWGMPNNDFDGEEDCEINPSMIIDGTGSNEKEREITAGTDLNDCLEDNFVDPTQGTADTKMKIDLSYSPENPINDSSGNNSDKLKIQANLDNIEDKAFAKYSWEIIPCVDAAGTICGTLTPASLASMGLIKTEGLGIDSIEMDLKIQEQHTQYLLVTLRVLESTQETSGKYGRGRIVIPLQHSQDKIIPHLISIIPLGSETAMDVKLSQAGSREDLCKDKICSAVKDEIIGLQFSGTADANNIYSWTLDGKPLNTDSGTAYFPVLKNSGSTYSAKLDITKRVSATDPNMTTDKITIARDFKIEDPAVEIVPGCEELQPDCTPLAQVELGRFIDPKYTTETGVDYSKDLFRAENNTTVVLSPEFNFDSSILEREDAQGNAFWRFNWFVDGIIIDENADPSLAQIDPDGSLRLHVNKPEGEKYKISIETIYTQSGQVKKALTGIWNIKKENFYEKSIADSLEIEVASVSAASYQPGTQKILGSIFSGMPSYVNFLFRTVLTLALILFVANLSFTLFPKQRF